MNNISNEFHSNPAKTLKLLGYWALTVHKIGVGFVLFCVFVKAFKVYNEIKKGFLS